LTGYRKLETGDSKLRARGFTLVELAVSISVIAVLAAVLLNRLAYYKELAEKAAMESMVRIIKTGLQIRLAELIITNRQGEAATLEAEDPTEWLDARPANYGGAYGENLQRGTWYFDTLERQLVYVINTGDRLDVDVRADPKQIRFRVRLLKDRLHLGGAVVDSVTGVTLAPLSPYRWQ
jgi:prepilin-type N-terminal cleavage/methylation domain-containing protein